IMPGKRHRDDSEAFFERLFAIANTSKLADDADLSFLKKLKHKVLSEDEEEEVIRKAAKEFTLEEAVREFELTWSGEVDYNSTHWWRIEEFTDVKNFKPSTCLAQLVVYLACLRQSRIKRGRSNTSVYGVATDGLSYIFVTITHEGVLKKSNLFDVRQGGLETVLGSLRYIFEMAMSMSPNLTPEKKKNDALEVEANADDVINIDDTPFLHEESEVDITN
ncbi:hypothetical protein JOM56_015298, partial [Amanita muscaria]